MEGLRTLFFCIVHLQDYYMAKDKIMISSKSQLEFGIMLTDKNGVNTIYHLNKDFEKIDPIIHELVEVNLHPLAGNKHFFISAKEKPQGTLYLVEVFPNRPMEHLKWEASNFLEGYLAFCRILRQNPINLSGKEVPLYKQTLPTFESFINFISKAYPNDYQNWKLIESDLRWVRKTFEIPVLP